MSVLMTLRVKADGKKIEELAAADAAFFPRVIERAKQHGVISHRFFATETEVLVIDEWPDEASFQAFFAATPEIQEVMHKAGVTTEPEIKFWHKLETHDEV